MRKICTSARIGATAVCCALLWPSLITAQETGIGDVFGDLVHVLRDPGTGQPILAQRWIELPAEIPGFGWGYCPIPLDALGAEIGFVPYTCDALDPTAVVDVDYFGRLNASRTREANIRMHFDEVIASIKAADWVDGEGSGRLRLYFDCTAPGDPATCLSWKFIDSPMENLALLARLIKYGTLQTDPLEINEDWHGDPEAPIVYHPALAPEDWAKMALPVHHLLPGDGLAECFDAGSFDPACAGPEANDGRDLIRAAGFAAGGADKTGHFTVDLVQYLGRILKLTLATDRTVATLGTLPALVRDCWPAVEDPPSPAEDDPAPVDPPYLPPGECTIEPASDLWPNYDLFPAAQELFVDFGPVDYDREEWRSELVEVILPVSIDLWQRVSGLSLLPWLTFRNGPVVDPSDIAGFVAAANDSLRWIEFIHNYEVPADLFADLDTLIFSDGFNSGDTSAWANTVAYLANPRG